MKGEPAAATRNPPQALTWPCRLGRAFCQSWPSASLRSARISPTISCGESAEGFRGARRHLESKRCHARNAAHVEPVAAQCFR